MRKSQFAAAATSRGRLDKRTDHALPHTPHHLRRQRRLLTPLVLQVQHAIDDRPLLGLAQNFRLAHVVLPQLVSDFAPLPQWGAVGDVAGGNGEAAGAADAGHLLVAILAPEVRPLIAGGGAQRNPRTTNNPPAKPRRGGRAAESFGFRSPHSGLMVFGNTVPGVPLRSTPGY
jgi:hypothetical protein